MAFHDVTPNKSAPPAAKSFLGLGAKFIVTPKETTGTGDMFATTDRLDRDFKLRVYFASASPMEESKSKLYVKLEEGDIPAWVMACLSHFFVHVRRK